MQYKPYWQRIFFLAILLHFIALSVILFFGTGIFPKPPENSDVEELEWVEVEIAETNSIDNSEVEIPEVTETFPEIEFPKIEMPPTPEPVVEETPPPEKTVDTPTKSDTKSDKTETESEGETEKTDSAEDLANKLKVLTKVFPKDIFAVLISNGTIKERPILNGGKIVLAIIVDVNGRVKGVEIRRGGGNDEHGNLINIISEAAALQWTFEPFRDSEGNLQEIKTQIEFNPGDF